MVCWGQRICNILPSFHALIGSDFTRTFFRRSKIQSFKKLIANPNNADLLQFLTTENANISDVTDFVLHVIYNRPRRERTPADSRYAMLFVGKQNKFASTKALPPDQKSLTLKILRANFVSHGWANCLNGNYEQLDPLRYGWKYEDDLLQPEWYQRPSLRSQSDIDEQLRADSTEFRITERRRNENDSESSDEEYDLISEVDNSSDSNF